MSSSEVSSLSEGDELSASETVKIPLTEIKYCCYCCCNKAAFIKWL